jgi:hypothetical protein
MPIQRGGALSQVGGDRHVVEVRAPGTAHRPGYDEYAREQRQDVSGANVPVRSAVGCLSLGKRIRHPLESQIIEIGFGREEGIALRARL